MVILKKITLSIISFLFLAPSFAQEKGDIGIIISSFNESKIALEYRKPVGEQFHFKLGFNTNQIGYYFDNRGKVISVSDSVIVERMYYRGGYEVGIRVGAERQLRSSMFSVGTDLNINYRQLNRSYYNSSTLMNDDGSWGSGPFNTVFPSNTDPETSHITRHFLVPSLRLSLNMNIPLGEFFLLNLSASSAFGLPIYMGATRVWDETGDFLGTPPSSLDFTSNFGIGLRYNIGSWNKKKG